MRRSLPAFLSVLCCVALLCGAVGAILLLGADSATLLAQAETAQQKKAEIAITLQLDDQQIVCACRPKLLGVLSILTRGGFGVYFEEQTAKGVSFADAVASVDKGLAIDLEQKIRRLEYPAKDATLTVKENGIIYTQEETGWCYSRQEVLRALAAVLDGNSAGVVRGSAVRATHTVEGLRLRTQKIAEYSTDCATSSPDRLHNIQLACAAINGITLPPGAEFSFNDTVGERTAERGYRQAGVIIDGEMTLGVGGGVCQVSTTLYNAAMLAGLRSVCVARHSFPVRYVVAGRDAMVSSATDLRFINDSTEPVYLFSHLVGDKVVVRILGLPCGRIDLSTTEQRTPSPTVDETGAPLSSTEGYVQLKPGRDKVVAELWRTVDGRRTRLRYEVYPGTPSVWQKENGQPQ